MRKIRNIYSQKEEDDEEDDKKDADNNCNNNCHNFEKEKLVSLVFRFL